MTLLDKVTSLNRSRFIEISICAAKDVHFSCYGGRYGMTWRGGPTNLNKAISAVSP